MPRENDREFQAAELEIARVRDLAGHPLTDLPIEERILARTLNRIDANEASVPMRSRPRGAWLAAAAVAAVLVIAVSIGLWPTGSAMASPPSLRYAATAPADVANASPGAEVVLSLADAAAAYETPGAGTLRLVQSFGWNTPVDDEAGRATITPFMQSWWLGQDGSALLEQTSSRPLLANGRVDPEPARTTKDAARDEIPAGDIPDLPATLLAAPEGERIPLLLEGMPEACDLSQERHAACVLEQMAWFMSTYLPDGDLLASLWREVAIEVEVRSLGATTDRLGREVVALAAPAVTEGAESRVLVVLLDPSTGTLAGTETIALTSEVHGITEPTVVGFTAIADTAKVSELGQVP